MVYFIAEDSAYYKEGEIKKLKGIYKLDKIISFPTREMIKELSMSEEEIGVISPSSPAKIDSMFEGTSFFTKIMLPNKYGVLTSTEYKMGVSPEEALTQKIGVKITQPTINFSQIAGGDELKGKARDILNKIKTQQNPKGLFLIGVPGTGKSFFAKGFAGEMGFYLAEVNLSIIMQHDNPIEHINYYFNYFAESGESYIIWIDEIEKMINKSNFASIQVLGALLTRLNELSNDPFSKGTVLTLATANNIEELSKTTPELFRKGRFDDIIFLDIPSAKTAKKVLELYMHKSIEHFRDMVVPFHFFGYFASKLEIKIDYQKDENYSFILEKYLESAKKVFDKKTQYFYQVALRDDPMRSNSILDKELLEELFLFQNMIEANKFKSDAEISRYVFNIFIEDLKNDESGIYNKCVKEYIEVFSVSPDEADFIMIKTIEKFRDVTFRGSGRGDKFPYVQAEIELLANDLVLKKKRVIEQVGFENYKNIEVEDLVSMSLKEMVPIQVALQSSIQKMVSVGEDFLKVS